MHKHLSLYLLLLSFWSCTPTDVEDQNLEYYDLKGFINQQCKLLEKQNPSFSKEVAINDVKQKKELKGTNWHKELQVFKDADINKSSLKGMYYVDTLHQNQNKMIIYKAKDDRLPIIQLSVSIDQTEKVKSVLVHMTQTNFLYTSNTQFKLFCKDGHIAKYNYNSVRKMLTSTQKHFKIVARINS